MRRAIAPIDYFDHLAGSLAAMGARAPGGRHASVGTYRAAALRLVRTQYGAATNVGDLRTAAYLRDVIAAGESLVLADVS